MHARTASLAAAIVIAGLVGATHAAAAPRPAEKLIVRDKEAAHPASFGGHLVWSTFDRSIDRFRLMQRVGGRTLPVPAAPSLDPFDTDMGPSEIGSPVAAYARCRGKGLRSDCDLELFDLTMAMAFRIPGTASDVCHEIAPATWKGTTAFVRLRREGRRGRACRPGLWIKRPGAPARRLGAGLPISIDVRGNLLAASYVGPGGKGRLSRSWIELRNLATGGRRVIATGSIDLKGRGPIVSEPAFDGGTLYFISDEGAYFQRILGRRVRPGGHDVITGGRTIAGFAIDGGILVIAHRGLVRIG